MITSVVVPAAFRALGGLDGRRPKMRATVPAGWSPSAEGVQKRGASEHRDCRSAFFKWRIAHLRVRKRRLRCQVHLQRPVHIAGERWVRLLKTRVRR